MNILENHPAVTALWCDDIRLEASGKFTIVGMYPDELVVPELPAPLGSLWVFASIWWPMPAERKELVISIWRNDADEPLVKVNLGGVTAADPSFGAGFIKMAIPFNVGDATSDTKSLWVTAQLDGVEVRSFALPIRIEKDKVIKVSTVDNRPTGNM